ncbi:MAG TPA: DUF3048 domain-containing protein [Thermoflexales bacterium]|nr:DUF3048 domain-containing protein [Thermoflexales bacterium]
MQLKRYFFLITLAMALAACGNNQPTPTSPPPVITIYAPTAAPATATVPAPTPAPAQTVAPTQNPSAPNTFAPDVNPYTGLKVADPAVLNRKPVIVKVNNEQTVRPQTGLAQADVVVEHIMEGGSTRFDALYLANAPTKVGSVRSCRLVDIELTTIFKTALVCSGTSPGVKPIIRAATNLFDKGGGLRDGVAIISDFGPYECATCPMFRTTDKPMPHNLYANLPNTWKELDDRKRNTPSGFNAFRFDANTPSGGAPAANISLKYRIDPAAWAWDAASGTWLRSIGGAPHIDAATGAQLSAVNVLVLQVPHIDTDIEEDSLGSKSVQIQLWNSGKAKLFRDGKLFEGTWERNTDLTTIVLRDATGKPLMLKPGNTWVQIIATGDQVSP